MRNTLLIGLLATLTIANVGSALINLSLTARADVAGMNYFALQRDRDFRRAVENIVESCTVDAESISC